MGELEERLGRELQSEQDIVKVKLDDPEDERNLGEILSDLIEQDREAEAPAVIKAFDERQRAKQALIDAKTGMLVSSFTYNGHPMDGPEGSSIWMVAHCLALLDEEFARLASTLTASNAEHAVDVPEAARGNVAVVQQAPRAADRRYWLDPGTAL